MVSDRAATGLQRARSSTIRWLQSVGFWPTPPDLYSEMEGAMRDALPEVRAPNAFRQQLGRDLDLAARSKNSGLTIEYPRPIRAAILVVVPLFIAALAAVTAFLIIRNHPARAEH